MILIWINPTIPAFQAETARRVKGFAMSILSEQEFNRYSISIRDFEKCIEFLQEMDIHSPNTLVFESLLTCALIFYCRPFSHNERSKDARATPKITIESFSGVTADERDLHKRCMEIRNKALAHAEWSYYPTERKPKTNVIWSGVYSVLSEDIDLDSLLVLVKKLTDQCHDKRAYFHLHSSDNS